MKLIIAEKPSVAKSIASALGASSRADGFYEGSGLLVSWCVGHLVSPMDAGGYDERFKKWRYDDLPILPESFRYVLAPGKEDAFENLRALMDRPDVDIIMLAPIFSGEYEGVDNIILTSKYGKTKCATAKVVAGIITAILTTTLIAAFNLLLAFVFYGTEGLDCSILFAPSDYVEAFIPFNITCGTLLKYQILLAFTCTLSVTGITLFLSAISKNQIVALVAAMAIFLFPVLLPITEVNPLFRLVGLLPIYHVLAISLLSVEQMSNGMLYAIWAIPAALLFLGVGAGISRRVFAKHQVL